MNNYLLFRTDRIGDFLLSSILLSSIKRNDPDSFITIICSSKNFNYIKNFHLVDEAILYPEKNFIKKIAFYINMLKKSVFCSIVCDGKKRSIYSSILTRSKLRILFTTKTIYKILFKIFFSKIYIDNNSESKIYEIKEALTFLNFNFVESDLNTINIKKNKNYHNFRKFDVADREDYLIFHFDEKWIFNNYIKTYKNIEPTLNEFTLFINNLVISSKKNLIITTGLSENSLINNFTSKCEPFAENIFIKKTGSNSIFLITKTSFFELEYLISKARLLIASHGAVTHVASSLNVAVFDIIDESEKLFFNKWSLHVRKYRRFFRKKFNLLVSEIIENI